MALKDWSESAASNDDADAGINWQEGQAPSTVNGSAREMMAVLKKSFRHVVSVRDYGAVGDGVTDDSTAIQTAINDVNTAGGGEVIFAPGNYVCNLTLKAGVVLVGNGALSGDKASYSSNTPVQLTAAATGAVVDTPALATPLCGVVGISVNGLGAGTACKGIRFRNVARGAIRAVNFNNISDEGLLVESSSIACTIEDVLATNCLLDRTQAAKIGAIDVDGTDHFLTRVESTTSQSALSDSNAFLCAVVIRGDNMMCWGVIGEISDEGIHIVSGAILNKFESCRADLNFGHGWHVNAASNRFANCDGQNNSQETNDTYSNFRFTSTSGLNQIVNCRASDTASNKAKYGFEDLVQSATAKNFYKNIFSNTAVTAQYLNQTTNGSSMEFLEGGPVTFTALDTTPSVAGGKNFVTNNSGGATTITNFDDGVSGQHIYVTVADSNTTFQHNGVTMLLPGGSSITGVVQTIYHFVKTGVVWRVVGGA